MKFAREGLPLVYGLGVATLVFGLLEFWGVGLFFLILTLGVAGFFRDPERNVPHGEDLVVCPADGRIVAIDECAPESRPGETFRRISIFMSPLNVHVNRVPATGQVTSVRHTPGRFLAAFSDRAPVENERNEVAMRDGTGRELVFVQIAGLLARRIICHLEPGQRVEQGARYGLIMFGSRVDVYLPATARLRVGLGDRVRAGSDILGELAS
ncbi:MAG: phosphatidylserine decarboxylase family protein [Candidatus Binatia bacterium]